MLNSIKFGIKVLLFEYEINGTLGKRFCALSFLEALFGRPKKVLNLTSVTEMGSDLSTVEDFHSNSHYIRGRTKVLLLHFALKDIKKLRLGEVVELKGVFDPESEPIFSNGLKAHICPLTALPSRQSWIDIAKHSFHLVFVSEK